MDAAGGAIRQLSPPGKPGAAAADGLPRHLWRYRLLALPPYF